MNNNNKVKLYELPVEVILQMRYKRTGTSPKKFIIGDGSRKVPAHIPYDPAEQYYN